MKNIIITVIIFLGLVGFVFARGMGMRMDIEMSSGSGSGGSFCGTGYENWKDANGIIIKDSLGVAICVPQ